MSGAEQVARITCLGCGCGCDDVTVTVQDGRIIQVTPVCPVEKTWLGDGSVPWQVLCDGRAVTLADALAQATMLLSGSRGRTLVYLGSDLTSQAQREAVALADVLKATVDTATSPTAASGILAAQRRGRATATLGEIRNRADVVLFWGVDPRHHYPRYLSRYAPEPIGLHLPKGRAGRLVISVSIGADKGPTDADLTVALEPGEEVAALSLMRAAIGEHPTGQLSPGLKQALAAVPKLTSARYAVLVHDGDPTGPQPSPLRTEGLIALTQALNGPTRAALSSLRAGGNCSGAESVLTSQTGYPFAVDYLHGHPRYAPGERGLDRLMGSGFSAAVVVGSPALGDQPSAALARIKTVAIGPRASEAGFKPAVAIDTGIAGIHEGGTAYRMDEVPLRLRPPLTAQRSTVETLLALTQSLRSRLAGRSA